MSGEDRKAKPWRFPSSWNSGATWEERDVAGRLAEDFATCLLRWMDDTGEDGVPQVEEVVVEPSSSRASIVFIRGRPKLGFELEFTITLRDCNGEYTVSEFCDYDSSFRIVSNGQIDQYKQELAEILSRFRPQLQHYLFA